MCNAAVAGHMLAAASCCADAHLQVVFVEVWQHAQVNLCCSKVLSNASSAYAGQPAGHHVPVMQ
jgi:hypothetical protein